MQYLPPPLPVVTSCRSTLRPPPSVTAVRSVSVVQSVALPARGELGPPPVETAYSPLTWSDLSDGQDSRPDTPLDFDNDPESFNPWSFLDSAAADDFAGLGQPPVDSAGAEATMGHGQPSVDPVVAPPSPSVIDDDFRSFLSQHGLIQQETVVSASPVVELRREVAVQTVDPRVIAPSDYVTYRQSFDTLVAASHMALLVRASTSMSATGIADQTAVRLGLAASDQPSWDALYRMAVTAVVVERHLQVRLAELLAASAVDPSGSLAVASVLLEMQARQRRPWVVDELPQPGDSREQFAIMPPDNDNASDQ